MSRIKGWATRRQLTNTAGAVTDTYEYDAFGNKVNSTGSTPNNYLYRGEQYDPDLGLYYLRARYYNPATGRFLSRDPEDGITTDPQSLQKYLYAGGDPVNRTDPSGRMDGTTAGPMPKTIGGGVGEYIGIVTIATLQAASAAVVFDTAVECAYQFLESNTTANVAIGLAGDGDAGTITRTGACTVKAKTKECTLGGAIGTVVIGEGMDKRIKPYADSIGAGYYDPPPGPPEMWLENNRIWINEVMDQDCKIFDGGPEFGRPKYPEPDSIYYIMELGEIANRGYPKIPVYVPQGVTTPW